MAHLNEIVSFLNTYFDIFNIEDSCWNGLQFEGNQNVNIIAGAVDASKEVFLAASEKKADLLITHHGHFWKFSNPSIAKWSKSRIDILYKNNLSLYSCHLPLDRHEDIGNNAQIIKLLEAKIISPFYKIQGTNIGWVGSFEQPKDIHKIKQKLDSILSTESKLLNFGQNQITTIAVCSGGPGYKGFAQAIDSNVDLYITGDSIDIYSSAKDMKLNIIFAGHNATERIGIKALLELLEKKYQIKTIFINMPTGL